MRGISSGPELTWNKGVLQGTRKYRRAHSRIKAFYKGDQNAQNFIRKLISSSWQLNLSLSLAFSMNRTDLTVQHIASAPTFVPH